MKKSNKKGFTIVELVIVIAVIAILAAVLIPTFSNVISKANESAALQAARNEFTEYLATGDNAKNMSSGDDYIIYSGDYAFVVENNALLSTAKKITTSTTVQFTKTNAVSATVQKGNLPTADGYTFTAKETGNANVTIYSISVNS